MSSSIGMIVESKRTIYGKTKHIPNHQPVGGFEGGKWGWGVNRSTWIAWIAQNGHVAQQNLESFLDFDQQRMGFASDFSNAKCCLAYWDFAMIYR